MARIRSIKPEFWTDEKIVVLSPLARLFFIGLWNFVDDYGRAQFSPVRLKMQILPAENADASEILGEIRRANLIKVYLVEEKEYFEVCGFTKHQKVDKRAASRIPPPPSSAESPRIPSADQGREGIKEGKEDAAGAAPTLESQLFARGKEVLGENAGGMIVKLLKAKNKNVPLARSAIEMAATKSDPREYIGAVIHGGQASEDGKRLTNDEAYWGKHKIPGIV